LHESALSQTGLHSPAEYGVESMKVRRTELAVKATDYARDFAVPRSVGCHLMQVVHAIQPQMDPHYKRSPYTTEDLENFALPGFLWEHAMERAEQLEHVLSYEALQEEKRIRRLHSPGEMFWCHKHDEVMWGGEIAREHTSTYGCKGIFWTPDAHDDDNLPEEFKVTWVSANRTTESSIEIWKYVTQTQWQAWGYGVNGCGITALFVNGDYTRPLKPQTYRFEIEYTPRELRNCHSMIVSNAAAMGMI
jgi:hypothetical protein